MILNILFFFLFGLYIIELSIIELSIIEVFFKNEYILIYLVNLNISGLFLSVRMDETLQNILSDATDVPWVERYRLDTLERSIHLLSFIFYQSRG